MPSKEQRVALNSLIELCGRVGACRQQLLDQLGEETAGHVGRLLSSCRTDASNLLAAVTAAGAGQWPPEVLGALVAAARAQGESWDDIGRHFGVSRQAAHQRFASYDARLRPIVSDLLTTPAAHRPLTSEQAVSGVLDAITHLPAPPPSGESEPLDGG